MAVTNTGTIAGGLANAGAAGAAQADAIDFTGGTNSLTVTSTSIITGNVVATGSGGGNTDTFGLGGGTNGTFALSQLGEVGSAAKYQGFDTLDKSGVSTWIVSGQSATTNPLAYEVDAGILDLGGVTRTIADLTLTGGTLANGEVDSSGILAVQAGAVSAVLGGAGGLTKTKDGTVTLSGANTYVGGTALNGGTLELGQLSSAGTGPITFGAGAQTLRLDFAGTLGASVQSFTADGDAFDLSTISNKATASFASGVLTVSDGTNSDQIDIAAAPTGYEYAVSNDGAAHARVTLAAISAPVITRPANSTDTNNPKPTISGTGESGDTVALSIALQGGGTTTATVAVTSGTWSYTPASGLADGNYAVTAVETSPSGTGKSALSNTETFTVDTTAPTIAINAPVAGDNTINAAEAAQGVTISGTTSGAEAGQVVTVQLVDGAGTVADSYTSTLTGSGTYAVAVTAAQAQALANGSYTVTADVSDKAGNPATEATQAVTVNETAPTITSVSDSGAGIDANGNGDLGAGKTVTFTVATSEAVTVTPGAGGATPTLTLNDGGVATYTGGSGTTQQTFSYTVAAGQNTAMLAVTQVNPNGATATDAAGNPLATSLAGASVPSGTLEVDTTAPVPASPTLTVAQNAGATPIGIAAPTDNLTATNGLAIVAGSLPSDGTVTLADGTTPVTSGEVLTAAQLTGLAFTPTPGAANQGSTFTYGVTDGAGNVSTGTAALNIGAAGAPTLAGTHATTDTAEAPVTPFAGVTLADPNTGTDRLAIALQNGGGTLSGAGLVANADGTYTLQGSAATVTQQLDALSFTPTAPPPGTSATTTFVLSDTTSAGTSVTDAGTSVTDTAAAAPPPPPSPAPPHIPVPPPTPAPDTVSFETSAAFAGHGTFVLTGSATSPAGVRSVEISAMVDGVETDLGAAAVNANGTFAFTDDVGSHAQGSITATATDTTGGTVSAMAPFDLAAGLRSIPGQPYGADEDFLDAGGNVTGTTYFERDGTVLFSSTDQTLPNGGSSYTYSNGAYFDDKPYASFTDVYRPDGQLAAVHELDGTDGTHKLIAEMNGVTLHSQSDDTMIGSGARDRFVFSPGFGQDTVANFNLSGGNHDTLSLASSDFTSLAQVLRETRDTAAGAVIHDAKSPGDTILLAGITKAELKAHPQDFAFHA